MLVEQLVSHRLACFELVGFIIDRAQGSSEGLDIPSGPGVEIIVAACRLAMKGMGKERPQTLTDRHDEVTIDAS
jgi:hypothetical protein